VTANDETLAGGAPALIRVNSGELDASAEIARLVEEVRSDADAFVFLSGGASKMSEDDRRQLLDLMNALPVLANRGVRLAVGDGGTKAGLMEAAGRARLSARSPFPLVGVAPGPEVDGGTTPVDPNHSHVVAVENPAWAEARAREGWSPDQGYWGSEVDAMFDLFGRLSRGRPAVAIVGNGGAVTLQEVRRYVEAGRTMIVVAGSGRAADALVSLLRGTASDNPEVAQLSQAAQAAGLMSRPELYDVFPAADGAVALADRIARHLSPPAG
jgi:hypothetical protein